MEDELGAEQLEGVMVISLALMGLLASFWKVPSPVLKSGESVPVMVKASSAKLSELAMVVEEAVVGLASPVSMEKEQLGRLAVMEMVYWQSIWLLSAVFVVVVYLDVWALLGVKPGFGDKRNIVHIVI